MNEKQLAAQRLGYELNKTYLCSYWREKHTIIDAGISSIGTPWVKSQWQKGNITTHSTARSKRDLEV